MDKKGEIVYSNKMRAGRRRTYFFDVRRTKGNDYYISISESTKRMNGDGFDKHMLFIYKEDFNRFLESLQATIGEVKTNLMPDFDYEAFAHRDNINAENSSTNSEDIESLNKEDEDLTW